MKASNHSMTSIDYLGVQMSILCWFLPLMIGNKVPDDNQYWLSF